jgi:3-oxoacyl-[acyl-carrier-protein] synthase-3
MGPGVLLRSVVIAIPQAETKQPAILGTGFSVPERIVGNDDPLFDYQRENQPSGGDLFEGYHERRFLAPGEQIDSFTAEACRRALAVAGLVASDVDRLLGYSTVSLASTPNDLGRLHASLNLRPNARVIAVNTEFTNFIDALEIAHSGIIAGAYKIALLAFGSNWSRYLDFRTAPSLSVGDGSGACVVGPATAPNQFRIVDSEALVDSEYFDTMQMAPIADPGLGQRFTHPYFQILPGGVDGFIKFAIPSVPQCVNALIARHGLTGNDITLATHQASSVMMKAWEKEIQPRYYASTFADYANTTLAALPITLAARYDDIPTDWVVLCGVGHYFHTTALLLGRNLPERRR